MVRTKTLSRYFLKESLPPFFLGILVFSFILITGNILKILQILISKGINIYDFLDLLFNLFIPLFSFVIPMSVMLSILIALSRLSIDNEITALKSLGISPYRLFLPALTMGVVATAVTSIITLYLSPRAFGEVKRITNRMIESGVTSTLREGAFTEVINGLTVYAKEVGKEGNHFYGIFIYDTRGKVNSYIAYADEGYISSDREGERLKIVLTRGSIHIQTEDPETLRLLNFSSYELSIPLNLSSDDSPGFRSPKEMPTFYLMGHIKKGEGSPRDVTKAMIQLSRRFSFPVACVVFVLISIPIGFLSPREGKLWGFTLSILLFTLYYILLIGSETLAYKGLISGFVAPWIPNLVFFIAGIYLNSLLQKPG